MDAAVAAVGHVQIANAVKRNRARSIELARSATAAAKGGQQRHGRRPQALLAEVVPEIDEEGGHRGITVAVGVGGVEPEPEEAGCGGLLPDAEPGP